MKEIKTVKDLIELSNMLAQYDPSTPINFGNDFQFFSVSKDFTTNALEINIECELKGTIFQGKHRVLGKE